MEPAIAITASLATAALLPALAAAAGKLARAAARSVAAMPVRSGPLAGTIVFLTLLAGVARPASAARPPLTATEPGPTPQAGPGVDAAEAPQAPIAGDVYVVQPGDSLWAIACRHLRAATGADPGDAAVDHLWRAIYRVNRGVVGANPDLIHPGQRLTIPEL